MDTALSCLRKDGEENNLTSKYISKLWWPQKKCNLGYVGFDSQFTKILQASHLFAIRMNQGKSSLSIIFTMYFRERDQCIGEGMDSRNRSMLTPHH